MSSTSASPTSLSSLPRPLLAAAGLIALAAVALTLFAWPQAHSAPHELPIGVAGPDQAVAPVEQRLAARGDDFDVERYADEAAARDAIEDREVYGAIVASEERPTLLTAPAASAPVAQMLEQAAAQISERISVVQVVPAPPDDPRGAAFSSSVLPMIMLGIAAGALSVLVARPLVGSLAFIAAGSALAGLTAVAIAQGWLGVLEGGWLQNAGAFALAIFAIGSTVAGLFRLIGPPGIAIAALLFVLVGNPWSGVATAPELLPPAGGAIGQLLPPGAAGDLVRGTAFFDGAATAGSLVVLLGWAAFGLAVQALALRRGQARRARPAAAAAAPAQPG